MNEADDFIFQFDCNKRILQNWFVNQDCKNITALENEVLIVVTNWTSKNTSKYTKELEFLSCCLLTVSIIAGRYFHIA